MHLELHKVNEDAAKVRDFLRVEPFQLYHCFISKLPIKWNMQSSLILHYYYKYENAMKL